MGPSSFNVLKKHKLQNCTAEGYCDCCTADF